MVQLMEEKRGTGQGIPQILAGASCDDSLCDRAVLDLCRHGTNGSANMMDFVNIPVSIVLGVALGAAVGLRTCSLRPPLIGTAAMSATARRLF